MNNSIDERFAKDMTLLNLETNLMALKSAYSYLYDVAHSDGENQRDAMFLLEMVDALVGITAVVEVAAVAARDKFDIHPNYVHEKLEISRIQIDQAIRYFDSKLKEEDKE